MPTMPMKRSSIARNGAITCATPLFSPCARAAPVYRDRGRCERGRHVRRARAARAIRRAVHDPVHGLLEGPARLERAHAARRRSSRVARSRARRRALVSSTRGRQHDQRRCSPCPRLASARRSTGTARRRGPASTLRGGVHLDAGSAGLSTLAPSRARARRRRELARLVHDHDALRRASRRLRASIGITNTSTIQTRRQDEADQERLRADVLEVLAQEDRPDAAHAAPSLPTTRLKISWRLGSRTSKPRHLRALEQRAQERRRRRRRARACSSASCPWSATAVDAGEARRGRARASAGGARGRRCRPSEARTCASVPASRTCPWWSRISSSQSASACSITCVEKTDRRARAPQLEHGVAQHVAVHGVEPRERLVEHEQLGPVQHRHHELELLRHALRQLLDAAVASTRRGPCARASGRSAGRGTRGRGP